MITEEMYLLAKKVIESYESKQLNIPIVSVSFDDEIDAELNRRSVVQYNDDDDEPHWDEGKLYWARKMFIEGAKWANER